MLKNKNQIKLFCLSNINGWFGLKIEEKLGGMSDLKVVALFFLMLNLNLDIFLYACLVVKSIVIHEVIFLANQKEDG